MALRNILRTLSLTKSASIHAIRAPVFEMLSRKKKDLEGYFRICDASPFPAIGVASEKIQFICKIVRWVRGSWEGCRAGSWCDRSRTERSSCPARWSSWRRWSRDRRHCWARIRSWFPGGRRWPCSLSCRCWNDKELRKYVKVSILSHLHPLQNVHDFIFLIHYVNFSLKARSQGLCKMQ